MKRLLFLVFFLLMAAGVMATDYSQAHGIGLTLTQSNTGLVGAEIKITSENLYAINLSQCAAGTATRCFLYTNASLTISNANLVANGTFSGTDCVWLSQTQQLDLSKSYDFLVDANGAAFTECYNVTTTTPVTNSKIEWRYGLTANGNGPGATITRQVNDMFQVTKALFRSITTVTNQTPTPSGFSVPSLDNRSIFLNWSPENVTTFIVYRDGVNVANTTSTSYNDTGLVNNTVYNHYIVAYNVNYTIPLSNFSVNITNTTAQTPQGPCAPQIIKIGNFTFDNGSDDGFTQWNFFATDYDVGTFANNDFRSAVAGKAAAYYKKLNLSQYMALGLNISWKSGFADSNYVLVALTNLNSTNTHTVLSEDAYGQLNRFDGNVSIGNSTGYICTIGSAIADGDNASFLIYPNGTLSIYQNGVLKCSSQYSPLSDDNLVIMSRFPEDRIDNVVVQTINASECPAPEHHLLSPQNNTVVPYPSNGLLLVTLNESNPPSTNIWYNATQDTHVFCTNHTSGSTAINLTCGIPVSVGSQVRLYVNDTKGSTTSKFGIWNWTVNPTVPTFLLPQIFSFNATVLSNNSISISWTVNNTNSTNLTQDNITVATGNASVGSHNATDLSVNTTYTYTLYASNAFGTTSQTITATTSPNTPVPPGPLTLQEANSLMTQAAIILIPLIMGFMLLLASFFLGEEHTILKIFMFTLAFITPIASFYLGSVVTFVNDPTNTPLQDAIGNTMRWVGILYFVLLVYIIIYSVVKILRYINKEKEERLRY